MKASTKRVCGYYVNGKYHAEVFKNHDDVARTGPQETCVVDSVV